MDSISTYLQLSKQLIGDQFDALLKKPLHFENEQLEKNKPNHLRNLTNVQRPFSITSGHL